MIETITIKNFKSITETILPLGHVNVFIGANGSGKSNILEAVGMVAAERSRQIEVNAMIQKGIRSAKPNYMVCSLFNWGKSWKCRCRQPKGGNAKDLHF